MAEATEKIEIHRGLKGVYFDRSRVCHIDGRAGELRYRGYSIHDLAERSTFEETSSPYAGIQDSIWIRSIRILSFSLRCSSRKGLSIWRS